MSRISRPAASRKPPGVPASVFEAGEMAKPPKAGRQPARWISADDFTLEADVPMPPRRSAKSNVVALRTLLGRLGPGLSVVLLVRHARQLRVLAAAEFGVTLVTRPLGDGTARVFYVKKARG